MPYNANFSPPDKAQGALRMAELGSQYKARRKFCRENGRKDSTPQEQCQEGVLETDGYWICCEPDGKRESDLSITRQLKL